ncbi:MAG: hypothetical protein CMC08_01045 [Flavobacteriaceae bacterium]|nr:hypothetical protein [Flavobacteriaceae bacterium]
MEHNYLRVLLKHLIVWPLAFGLWMLLRNFGQTVDSEFNSLPISERVLILIALGLVAGSLFGFFEMVFEKHVNRAMSLGKLVIVSSLSHLTIIFVLIFLSGHILHELAGETFYWETFKELMFSNQMALLLLYFFIVITLISVFNEIDKRLGQGNLWKLFTGAFYVPKEDNRIFLFIDLKSSTTIAETIGHLQYSRLLQECFRDLSVVAKSKAQIYQHVGDEAVLTWPTKLGIEDCNCLNAFFDFKCRLLERAPYYLRKYGVVPEFKAGMHYGKIIVAEVGELKREMAYHGDTINIAARLQEKCNELGKEMLVSAKMKQKLKAAEQFHFDYQGKLVLKGKSKVVKLYSVEGTSHHGKTT